MLSNSECLLTWQPLGLAWEDSWTSETALGLCVPPNHFKNLIHRPEFMFSHGKLSKLPNGYLTKTKGLHRLNQVFNHMSACVFRLSFTDKDFTENKKHNCTNVKDHNIFRRRKSCNSMEDYSLSFSVLLISLRITDPDQVRSPGFRFSSQPMPCKEYNYGAEIHALGTRCYNI